MGNSADEKGGGGTSGCYVKDNKFALRVTKTDRIRNEYIREKAQRWTICPKPSFRLNITLKGTANLPRHLISE